MNNHNCLHKCDTIKIEKVNVDSKAECVQLNLAHATRKMYTKKKKLKQSNASAHLVTTG